jgi:serine/threonine protein kinase
MAASGRRLGRFKIRRELQTSAGVRCFHANDEPPSAADVLLREFAIDPTASEDQLDALLAQLAREMVVLRKLRHPNLVCVTGHFRLPASWVEVSDWFDGRPMEETWPLLSDASALEKLAVFLKVIQALEYCHERGVFHRNVTAEAVSVSDDLSDVRLGAFGLARDLSRTSTVTTTALRARDPRLVPPEELLTGATSNSRLGDVFQAGVLLYRLLENGAWPFSSSLEYATAPAHDVRPFVSSQEPETPGLRRVALQMIAPDPSERPDQLKKVERVMEGIATGRNDM